MGTLSPDTAAIPVPHQAPERL